MKPLLLLGLVALVSGCAGRSGMSGNAVMEPGLMAEFRERIDRYMELREDAAGEAGDIETSTDPAVIRRARESLAAAIRMRRAGATHGDIFSPDVRVRFRRALAPEFTGEDGADVRAKLQDDAPSPGAVPLEVNASYPAATPLPTTPAVLLSALPTLPRGLEYRIIGRDLVLLDSPANLILDFIRNAIPQRPGV